MRWLAFGTYDVARHPRVGVLIEGLRAAGDEVVELNVPLALDTAARVAMLRQPWRVPILAAKLARCWTTLALRSRPWRRGGADGLDAVLVGYLGHFDVRLARRLFPRTLIVLDHLVSAAGTATDRGLAGRDGVKATLMRLIDDGALRRADVVLVDTDAHARVLPPPSADRAVVVPVGAGAAWFAAGAAASGASAARTPGSSAARSSSARSSAGESSAAGSGGSATGALRVIFVGLFTPLHGAPTLGAALAALAADERVEVTMVGTGQDHAECRRLAAANPQVTWVDWVRADDLPALVAAYDVSLGIFGTTAKARAVVPTKVYQGAAAGCGIVTSDTPPQRAALGDGALYVPPGDAEALAAALRDLAGDRALLTRLRALAAARAAERFTAVTVVDPVRGMVRAASRARRARQRHESTRESRR